MKTLYLNRHAKSSWGNPELSDFDRPLNKRGKRDAPFMGKILSEKVYPPQLVYSSSAKRAIITAIQVTKFFNYKEKNIIKDKGIYDASVSDLIRIINAASDDYEIIMIFGHNPTFTMASNFLSNKYIDNIPTSGFVQIDFDVESWREVNGNTGNLVSFEYPKKYLK